MREYVATNRGVDVGDANVEQQNQNKQADQTEFSNQTAFSQQGENEVCADY